VNAHRFDGHGILLIDKPAGLTSADVVRDVKRRLGGAKVGHLGTLDPFATGLLPLCVGEGSKIVPFLNESDKGYRGAIRLGAATDTLDATGVTTDTAAIPEIAAIDLPAVAARFLGEREQVPPMYSALKRSGVPLYELARRGVVVDREPRKIRVRSLELVAAGRDEIGFAVECSKGTYVRVLADEIARHLGTVGHLSTLRRTRFGPLRVEDASAPDRVGLEAPLPIVGLRDALPTFRELVADEAIERRIRLGQQAVLRELPAPRTEGEIAKTISPEGDMIAVLRAHDGSWSILRVFAESR
jgi:tRNA pseudouridine55 synthase